MLFLFNQVSLDEFACEDPVYLFGVISIAPDVTVDDLFKTPTIKVRSGERPRIEKNVLYVFG